MASRFGNTLSADIIVSNPISPAATTYALYVPRANLMIYTGGSPPPVVTSYYLNEDGVSKFLTEDGTNLLILES